MARTSAQTCTTLHLRAQHRAPIASSVVATVAELWLNYVGPMAATPMKDPEPITTAALVLLATVGVGVLLGFVVPGA